MEIVMTKEELIAKLMTYPKDAEIFVSGPDFLGVVDDTYGCSDEIIIHCSENLS
jgi:hypothetical protein